MPFRPGFDCLWCGTAHAVRSPDDIEGWAQLCPACVGRAGENPFLGFKLRQALAERGRAAGTGMTAAGATASVVGTGAAMPPPTPAGAEAPDENDDRYLRRGRFARGPIHDAAWDAELDAAGRWLDALPIAGEIVELAAGTGWWSALLAGKGTLSVFDESPARLDRARDRLVAHRLRAHLHVRDRWARPDRAVDALFIGPGVAEVPAARLAALAALAHDWLRPGGTAAIIDLLPDAFVTAQEPAAVRADAVPAHDPAALPAALAAAGFSAVRALVTGRFFVLVHATA